MADDAPDVATRARALFKRDESRWSDIYTKARDDLHFLSDEDCAQWNEKDYQDRITSGRPALTIDQLSQFVHQVSNDIRQNTPTLTVIPNGSEASQEAAEAYKGLIRNIEYISNADDVYDTAANNSVKSSVGFIRIDHDYCNDEGFEQELLIKRVINPLACWIDSDSIECDGRDAMHGTIIDKITVKEFKRLYPEKEVSSFEAEDRDSSRSRDDELIQIAEFFEIIETEKTIAADDQGNVIAEIEEGAPYKTTRKIKTRKVMRYKLSGKDVLEETTFPGQYIPLIPVYGEEAWVDGKRNLFSLIRKSKDAQRMYNVWKSLETEVIMKQPQAPIMAAEGQVEDYAQDWKDPSKASVLRFKTTDVNGNSIGAPQRLAPPQIPSGIVNASRETVDDIKATMGLYNASIGQRSNETSGVAINQRKQEGDVATFHFYDNLVRSITHVYRVLIDAIPEIYDTQRIIRIIGDEDEAKELGINGAMAEEQEAPLDLSKGKYTVKVVPGASYTTKRQEAATFYTEVVTKMPELMNVMGDLLFKNSDIAGSEAMAERMKKIIQKTNPDLIEPDKDSPPQVDPEKQQMAQIIEQGAQELQSLQGQIEQKDVQAQMQKAQDDLKAQYAQLQAQQKIATLTIQGLEKDLQIAQLQASITLKEQADAQESALEDDVMQGITETIGTGVEQPLNSI